MIEIRNVDLASLDKVADRLIPLFKERQVICFFAEMGMGKTTFIKHLCHRLGVRDAMNSPTFSLVNEYHDENGQSIYHFDFYRIEDPMEAYDIGFEDYLYSGNLCLIEWPERIDNLLPDDALRVEIDLDGNERVFKIFDE